MVLDTNIVLDCFVFSDPAALPLRERLQDGGLQWIADAAMREEFARVLDYPQIRARLACYELDAAQVLAAFDRHARILSAAPRAQVICEDPDDQKFIDLAVAHRALLLSKDQAVLRLARRLQPLQVPTGSALAGVQLG